MTAVSAMPVLQFQILARNPERAAEFYARVFGWSVHADNAMAYRQLRTGGLDGGIWPIGDEGHPLVQLFVEVPDVGAAVQGAVDAGARVIIPPSTLPDGDEMSVIADPEGIPFGLYRRAAKADASR